MRFSIENTDALTFLQGLPDGTADLLFTDPPYSSGGKARSITRPTGKKYTNGKTKLPDFAGETMDQRANFRFTLTWMLEARRVLKNHAYIGVFTDWRQYGVFADALQAAGFNWSGAAVWNKGEGVRPALGAFRNQGEFILWGTKGGKAPDARKILPGCFHAPNVTRNKLHQTQKPVVVMEWLLSIADPGVTVLDPFMGSGTTGVAALRSGNRFLGCELIPDIYKAALTRLSAEPNARGTPHV